MTRRLVMLGVDGLDWFLTQEWSADGRLPTLRTLMEQSTALLLGESNRALPGSVWTDIATGVSAAIHGFQHEEQLRPGTYQIEKVDSSRVSSPPFYRTLSEAGVRCAVVDYPIDHPIDGFNGLQVVDWASEFKLWHFETRPPGMAAEIDSRYGPHPLTRYPGTRLGLDALLELKHKLLHGIDIKRRFCIDLLQQDAYRFVFFNFCELHKAGHFFWCFHDRSHPEFTESVPGLVDALRETYEHMDRALGAVMRQLSADDDLVLVTDRGMYADHRGDHLVDAVLLRLGLAARRGSANSGSKPGGRRLLSSRTAKRWVRSIAPRLPHRLREALLPWHRAITGGPAPWDWSKTQVFRLPSVGNSYLRVNLAGREPEGIVHPGGQYEALLSQLERQFRALTDPETGSRVVEDIYFPALQFRGPRTHELPDVAIVWSPRRPINVVESDAVGRIAGQQVPDRSGNHRPEGFALFRGPSFARGTRVCQGDARQVAPAVLRAFGLPAPPHYEMQAPEAVFASTPRGIAREGAPPAPSMSEATGQLTH